MDTAISLPRRGKAVLAAHSEPFDLLLGRRTYDIWSGFWPKAPGSPLADCINAATKYVATHRPEGLEWGPFECLGPDVVEGVRRIKAMDGPGLILWGSSTLTSKLLEHGLADEVLLFVYPILLGKGKRFFSDGTPPSRLVCSSTIAVSSGVLISTYTHGKRVPGARASFGPQTRVCGRRDLGDVRGERLGFPKLR